jgi:hypothetical protein
MNASQPQLTCENQSMHEDDGKATLRELMTRSAQLKKEAMIPSARSAVLASKIGAIEALAKEIQTKRALDQDLAPPG